MIRTILAALLLLGGAANALAQTPAGVRGALGPTRPSSARSTRSWSRPTRRFRRETARSPRSEWRRTLKPPGFPDGPPSRSAFPTIRRKAAWSPSFPAPTPRRSRSCARAHRRRRGQARGLDPRSVQAGRGERLFLRPRHDRRQSDGGDLGRHPGPLQEGRIPAAAHAQDGADLRRGDGRRVQRRRISGEEPARPDRRGLRDQRGRRRHDRCERQAALSRRPGRREAPAELPARSDQSRAATARGRCPTTPSITWPTRWCRSRATTSRYRFNDTTRDFFTRMAADPRRRPRARR